MRSLDTARRSDGSRFRRGTTCGHLAVVVFAVASLGSAACRQAERVPPAPASPGTTPLESAEEPAPASAPSPPDVLVIEREPGGPLTLSGPERGWLRRASWLDDNTVGYWTDPGEVGLIKVSSGETLASVELSRVELPVDVRYLDALFLTQDGVVLPTVATGEQLVSVRRVRFADGEAEVLLSAPGDAIIGAALSPDRRVLTFEYQRYRHGDYVDTRTHVALDLVDGTPIFSRATTMPEGRWGAYPEYRFVGDAGDYELYAVDSTVEVTSIDCDNPSEYAIHRLSLATGTPRDSMRIEGGELDESSVVARPDGAPGLFAVDDTEGDRPRVYHHLLSGTRPLRTRARALTGLPWKARADDQFDRRLDSSAFVDDARVLSWYEPNLYLWSPRSGAIEARWSLDDPGAPDDAPGFSEAAIHPSGLVALSGFGAFDGVIVWELARGGLVGCATARGDTYEGIKFDGRQRLTVQRERGVELWRLDEFRSALSLDACPSGLASRRVPLAH